MPRMIKHRLRYILTVMSFTVSELCPLTISFIKGCHYVPFNNDFLNLFSVSCWL